MVTPVDNDGLLQCGTLRGADGQACRFERLINGLAGHQVAQLER